MLTKWVGNLQPFMEDQVCLKTYSASLCCSSCKKKDRRRRWSAMSFRIRLRSLAVSTRACTSCFTRITTSNCQQSGFLSFARRWFEPDSLTVATFAPNVLGLALLRYLASQDFFGNCAFLWPFFHNRSKKPLSCGRFYKKSWQQEHHFTQVEQK